MTRPANAQLLSEERRQGVLGDEDDQNDSGNDEPDVYGGAQAGQPPPGHLTDETFSNEISHLFLYTSAKLPTSLWRKSSLE